jgi:Ni,Fe-hydrogenase I large subunit
MNLTNSKKLEVYYYLDNNFETPNDIDKCLRLFLEIKFKEYELVKCENFTNDKIYDETDFIKNGLLTFNNMYNKLKLKSNNVIWFMYLSNGNIKELYKKVFVILLNKSPHNKECTYIINKRELNIDSQMNRDEKLENLKYFNKTLQELFYSGKQIKYDNLQN